MSRNRIISRALAAAFPCTLPILAGFLLLGIAYGIYMKSLGFSAIYPFIMSTTIFAGSMEFIGANLLLGNFDPHRALLITLMVNARHLFYGISMLNKYNVAGLKRYYLIFGMCDESFSINCTATIPPEIDQSWFMFFVTLLNHLYWVVGATLGGILGTVLEFNTRGLDFVMTALFTVLFLEQWLKEKEHHSALLGLGVTALCLLLLGPENFIIPAMLLILATLTVMKSHWDTGEDNLK